jgi:hypothetical protein
MRIIRYQLLQVLGSRRRAIRLSVLVEEALFRRHTGRIRTLETWSQLGSQRVVSEADGTQVGDILAVIAFSRHMRTFWGWRGIGLIDYALMLLVG